MPAMIRPHEEFVFRAGCTSSSPGKSHPCATKDISCPLEMPSLSANLLVGIQVIYDGASATGPPPLTFLQAAAASKYIGHGASLGGGRLEGLHGGSRRVVRLREGHRMGQNAHWSRPMGRRRHGGDLVGRCDAQDGAITAVAPRKKTPKVRETEFEFREREAGRSLRVILTEENIWNG